MAGLLIGIGTDLFRISRIAPQSVAEGDPFLMRAYTEAERAEADGRAVPIFHYAACFAGKEAVYKAISGCGVEFCPGEIEITEDGDGRPAARLLGKTKERFEEKFGCRYALLVSLSYETEFATAFAAAETL